MAEINLNEDIIFPEPGNQKEQDLYTTLSNNHKSIVTSFQAIKNIEKVEAGTGITDTSNTFSVDTDDSTIQVGGSGLEIIPGGVSHDNIADTHNLTTDIDHSSVTNTHNLTTDIDHDALTNFTVTEHFTMIDDDSFATASDSTAASSESVKAYVDTEVSGISGSLSNVIFTWSHPTAVQVDGDGYDEILWFKYKHSDDISTVTIWARLLAESAATGATLKVTINTANADVTTTSTTFVWASSDTIDVSGLSDGETYDCKVELKGGFLVSDYYGECNAVTLIAS